MHRKDQWHQQHETHVVKKRDAYYKPCYHQRPAKIFFTKGFHQYLCDLLGRAAFCHQFSQHGSKTNDGYQCFHRFADTIFYRAGNFIDRYAQPYAGANGNDQEGKKRIEFPPGNQQYEGEYTYQDDN